MAEYRVRLEELWLRDIKVEASSEIEALEKASLFGDDDEDAEARYIDVTGVKFVGEWDKTDINSSSYYADELYVPDPRIK